jgi:hypothetical protein
MDSLFLQMDILKDNFFDYQFRRENTQSGAEVTQSKK